ncbi:MAG: TlpA disulfide reductase family protein [Nocardioides sp.]
MTRRLVVLLLASVLALTGCTSLSGTGEKGFVSGDGQLTVRTASEREQPIELTGEGLDGESLDVADYRGTPVVVVVWGAWCAPCVAEAPEVVEAAEELGDEAQFLGINLRDPDPAQAQAFVRNFDVPYPSIYAPDGKAMLAFDGVLAPNSIPSFVVLDGEGRVAATILGALPSVQTLVDVTRDVAEESTDG